MTYRPRRRQRLDRVTNACEPCKKRKVKCSGRNPCDSCTARHTQCIFKPSEKKVIVSESYLRKLQESHAAVQRAHTSTQGSTGSSTQEPSPSSPARHAPPGPTGQELITNPLVSASSFYLKDRAGRFYEGVCGPSSTWAFSQRVFIQLKQVLPDFPSPDVPFHIDGSAWELTWNRTSFDDINVLDGLPSLNDALYLLNVVKFHSYQMLFLYDEDEFLPHLHELYKKGLEKARNDPLWFIQYLLIMALAKLLHGTSKGSHSPPGSVFFERAMSLMPDFIGLNRKPSTGMQILYLAGLYLVSVDMKDAAYAYISQAARMCIIEGLYREPPSEIFGVKFADQCRNIWWTAYILERQVSAMVGAPTAIQDTEITCSLPCSYDDTERAQIMTMHVRLSRIIGNIVTCGWPQQCKIAERPWLMLLTAVYTAETQRKRSFITTIQSILRDVADILQDIEGISARTAHPSLRTVSTITSHLSLMYHQCIMLATRPLFLYFLTIRLRTDSQRQGGDTLIPPQLTPLLETSLQSAKMSLKILFILHEQSALASFLPFDLDSLFSSAFIVILAVFIDPSLVPDMSNYTSIVSQLLNDLVAKGNMAAHLRKKELDLLQQMIRHLIDREEEDARNPSSGILPYMDEHDSTNHHSELQWVLGDEETSMSHTQILTLAQQLDNINDSTWGNDFELEYSNFWV
ncbi:hypothetical protein BDV25DRAFT_128494 [Aspergillus avenaceus]|uniref:Zn(2)-C6 fungal-type domain-containing protein n=1 Tax=Aspergillus avenaceus TaxID=36643 RepID=A0A5N6TZM5_ASPAV|nr:hypothetical protein BDV25DRAFT_128494 [Aspergillus avenaceus]